jgi:hypothetical protein
VSMLHRLGRLRSRRWGIGFSLAPLIVFSLLTAVLVTQSSVILAYPLFQSPVQIPTATIPPPQPPTEGPSGPPEESPVAPPGESPVPPPPPEEPGESPTAVVEPGATPTEGLLEAVGTATPAAEEGGPPSVGGLSLAVLIDALVVALSSVWLCCGGIVLVIFILLVIASFVLRVT